MRWDRLSYISLRVGKASFCLIAAAVGRRVRTLPFEAKPIKV